MQIPKIQYGFNLNYYSKGIKKISSMPGEKSCYGDNASLQACNFYNYNFEINFKGFTDPNRTVADMEFENYASASEWTKKRYRKLYDRFTLTKDIDRSQLFDPKNPALPLRSEKNMDEFIKTSKIYADYYKENPIICLGRSPKWFLNTALWMKDGIPDYKFAAFSKSWYIPRRTGGVLRIDSDAPTEKEVTAYRKYLKRIQVDPALMVNKMKETGKKTVITDYIYSGKGACSFLEILGDIAKEQGVLEDFAKSIKLVGIGSLEYMEESDPFSDEISIPKVNMPNVLEPYSKCVEQKFYDMDYCMFREMLLNPNTNECRSTYYPHEAWTVYKPDKFKTGMVKDMKKVKQVLKELKDEKYIVSFYAAMGDFRNLVNFRILDALNSRKLLKASHFTRL